MTRTLHLIDQPGALPEAMALRLSADAARQARRDRPSRRDAWLLFGGEPMQQAAIAAGLEPSDYRLLPMPTGLRKWLPGAMRSAARCVEQAQRVVCWTEGAAKIASMLNCAEAMRRVDLAKLGAQAKAVIDDAVAHGPSETLGDRDALRRQWGTDDHTVVVALLSDHLDRIDCRGAFLVLAYTREVLRACDPVPRDVRLLCHPLTPHRLEAAELSEMLQNAELILQDPRLATPWSVLAGCDAAIAPVPSDAGLSILWAEAMGVPTITALDDDLAVKDELRHIVPAESGSPKNLAHVLTNWVQSRRPAESPTPVATGPAASR
ncbi:MAG: hypothetical protein ACPGYV_12875 [Phycisphaeraceae bacterium]